MLEEITEDTFDNFIQTNENAITYFFKTTCGGCKTLSPILEKLAKKFKGTVHIGQIDIKKHKKLAKKYNIYGTPTLIFFKKGNKIKVRFEREIGDRIMGAYKFKKLRKFIKGFIKME